MLERGFLEKKCLALAFVVLTAASLASLAATQEARPVIDLGAGSKAYGINNNGAVCGSIPTQFFEAWPCKWKGWDLDGKGSDVDMPDLPGLVSVGGTAFAINNKGAMVGSMVVNIGTGETKAFVWPAGEPPELLSGQSDASFAALDLNDSKEVCGYNFFEAWPSKWKGWDLDDGPQDISTGLPGISGRAAGIDQDGLIVGSSTDAGGTTTGFWRLPDGAAGALDPLTDMTDSKACGVNNVDQAVGVSWGGVPGDNFFHHWPSKWKIYRDAGQPQEKINLGNLGGSEGCAYAINDAGDAVGYSTTAGGDKRACVWWGDSTGPTDLNDYVPSDSGWVFEEARDINEDGWIVGWGSYNGEEHGFLLIPEPTCVALLVIGGVALLRRRKS